MIVVYGNLYLGVNKMAYKKCKGWIYEEYVIATCPYCDGTDTYFGCAGENDILRCSNSKCQRKFVLGKEA